MTMKRWMRAFVATGLIGLGACLNTTPPPTGNENRNENGNENGHETPHFAYSGENGPEHWGELSDEWATCSDGTSQSPINIDTTQTVPNANLDDLVTQYQETPGKLLNNGHTLEVEYEGGSTLTVGSQEYALLQFHFHVPSEHTVDGVAADMELHLVHQNADGGLAVVAVMIDTGSENAALAPYWNEFPEDEGEAEVETAINAADLLPDSLDYYTYSGSLTTPPCSQDVTWFVLKGRISASQEQIDHLVGLLGNNVRPVQPLNGRTVEEN